MIKITWHPEYRQLTIEGHAEAAPRGEDIVCASVSAIWHTLAANAMHWKDHGYLMDMRMQEIKGNCQLYWVPRSRYRNILSTIAAAIVLGLEELANSYPEFIEFHRLGQG